MAERRAVTIAVDAMGGDHAPGAVLDGVSAVLERDPGLHVSLVGPPEMVEPFAASRPRVNAVAASQVIAMDEHPATAVRSKKDSSIVVGCLLVADDQADAFFSVGNTGATMAAATLVMGRIEGVSRPALAAVIPGPTSPTVLLDAGANAENKAEHLLQFAHMGVAYATIALGRANPTVGLLSIGEESTKGSALVLEAHGMLRAGVPGFIGNVEGGDILASTVDVVVTDGFTGNVALKVMEGVSRELFAQVRGAMLSSAINKAASAVFRPSLAKLRAKLDPETYGGAPLLGVAGVCIIGHGSSGPRAIASGIEAAARVARGGLVERIAEAVSAGGNT